MMPPGTKQDVNYLLRARIWSTAIMLVGALFVIRLFYVQVIKHDYYKSAAFAEQFKEYEIPAERGIIEAHSGDGTIPIVLNETKYTLFADPKYVENIDDAAAKLQAIIGGDQKEYAEKMSWDTRYAVLAKKLDKQQSEAINDLGLKGIGTRETSYRTYPQGTLAAHLLGFVNDEGKGSYGVEEYLDEQLKGEPGQLKAITDVRGIPLVTNKDNVVIEPDQGDRVVLTIDIAMQKQLENILKKGLNRAKSKSGSVLVMEAKTGNIKAMANYPTYKPAEFFNQKDANVFNNAAVSSPLEIGSVMKPLTFAAALDQGVISKNTSYFDPGYFKIEGYTIENVEEVAGSGKRTVKEILQRSLNTGATWLLMQMGDGEVNEQARVRWHDYMTNHYRLGKATGIEQGFESAGNIPDPKDGFGLNIQYANTAFGQGMTATPLQLAAATASVVNGGTYYRPKLVDKIIDGQGREQIKQPEVLVGNVVSTNVGKTTKEFMESVVQRNYLVYGFKGLNPAYSIGGKTGTAQIANPSGGYYEDKFNGMFSGFVGGDEVQYIVVVRVDDPKIYGYAGSRAAGPIFADTANALIDNFNVLAKSR